MAGCAYAGGVQTTPATSALDAVGIVTPEAVVLEFPTASIGSRTASPSCSISWPRALRCSA